MSGAIKKTEIVEADLNQLSEELHKVGIELESLLTLLSKKPPKNEGLSGIKQDTEELTFSQKELGKQAQELGRITAKLENVQSNYNKEIIKTRIETATQNNAIKQQIIQNNALEGSYDKLNATLNQTIREYKSLSQADRENIAIGGEMIKNIQLQDAELKQLDATMGRNQRNVGNYKSGFNGLNFSIMQVGRELPSLAYGFSTFVGAISNNIPMVTDEITRAKIAIKEAKDAGKESTPIWKQLGSAIFSWQTAMVVALTVLTVYGREIIGFIGGLFKTTEAIDRAKLAQEEWNKIRLEGINSAQSELTRLNLLWSAYKNVNTSQSDKLKIQDELQSKYPAYFKNLGDETFNVGLAEKGYFQLKNAILEAANARVFADEIAKSKGEIVTDLEPKLQKANDAITKFIDEHKISLAAELTSGYEGIPLSNIRLESLKKESKLIEQEILQRNAKIFKLNNEINPAALIQDYGVGDGNGGKDGKDNNGKKAKKVNGLRKEQLIKEFNEEDKLKAQRIKDEQKFLDEEAKKVKDQNEKLSNDTLSDAESDIHEEALLKYAAANEEIQNKKWNADKIREIQEQLELDLIESERRILQAKLDSGNLTANDYEQTQKRINNLEENAAKKGIDISVKTDAEKTQLAKETMQATNEFLQQGLNFAQQIYSAQATRAQETYDTEMEAAGDSLEYQTLAKRKFEAEDKKIKQRQAIASKLQAVLDAGLALALAIATTWKNPFLAALNIGAATIGLGMALATPIPQFAEGTDFTPSTFIAGEEGSELIKTKSGKTILTPNKATLFSDNSLIGSSIIPHDQTQRMLANMAFNQVHDVIDLSKTNKHLESMDKQMKGKIERSVDARGRTVIKRGSLVSTL